MFKVQNHKSSKSSSKSSTGASTSRGKSSSPPLYKNPSSGPVCQFHVTDRNGVFSWEKNEEPDANYNTYLRESHSPAIAQRGLEDIVIQLMEGTGCKVKVHSFSVIFAYNIYHPASQCDCFGNFF